MKFPTLKEIIKKKEDLTLAILLLLAITILVHILFVTYTHQSDVVAFKFQFFPSFAIVEKMPADFAKLESKDNQSINFWFSYHIKQAFFGQRARFFLSENYTFEPHFPLTETIISSGKSNMFNMTIRNVPNVSQSNQVGYLVIRFNKALPFEKTILRIMELLSRNPNKLIWANKKEIHLPERLLNHSN
jgi:hypothetical protein